MPELPEIETIRRDLEASVAGATVTRVKATDPLIITPAAARRLRKVAVGRVIESLERCGKVLIINLSGGHSVLQRFGMTGQMYPLPAGQPLPAHTRMVWDLADGRRLIYRDARRFGETMVVKSEEVARVLGEECGLGRDALSADLTEAEFRALLADHRTPIKSFLLDQAHLAGIGNIYASEILHRCRIHPETPANSLSRQQARRLLRTTRRVMREAVAAQGTTISDYRTGENLSGGYQRFLRVYGREGLPCRRRGCPGIVVRSVHAGRSTYHCPVCQPDWR